MPKYWVKNYFAHGSFPEVCQKQKTEKKKKKEREKERLNNGDNNGQATHGARKHVWRTQAAWANLRCLFILIEEIFQVFHSAVAAVNPNQKETINQHILLSGDQDED